MIPRSFPVAFRWAFRNIRVSLARTRVARVNKPSDPLAKTRAAGSVP